MMFVGVGKLRIASRYFLQGQTLVEVISKPVNSTVSAPNTNLSGLRMMPLWPQLSSHSTAWKKLLVRLSAQRKRVVNAFGLVRDMRDNLIKSSGVAVT